jgi:hypothetical protein
VAPVLAPRPVLSFGGSPAGVVEPNEKKLVFGAAGVVDPKEGSAGVAVEEGALVEAGEAPKLKEGVGAAVVPLDPAGAPKSEVLLPPDVVLFVVLFPNPVKPPGVPLVPNNDGVLLPVDFAPPRGWALALPKLKGLEESAIFKECMV